MFYFALCLAVNYISSKTKKKKKNRTWFFFFKTKYKILCFCRTKLAQGSWWAPKASQWTETATSSWSTTRPAAFSSFSLTASWSPSSVTVATVTDSLQVHSMVICALPPTVVLQPAHTCMWNEDLLYVKKKYRYRYIDIDVYKQGTISLSGIRYIDDFKCT